MGYQWELAIHLVLYMPEWLIRGLAIKNHQGLLRRLSHRQKPPVMGSSNQKQSQTDYLERAGQLLGKQAYPDRLIAPVHRLPDRWAEHWLSWLQDIDR